MTAKNPLGTPGRPTKPSDDEISDGVATPGGSSVPAPAAAINAPPQLTRPSVPSAERAGDLSLPQPVTIWGLPLVPWTFDETVDAVDRLIAARQGGYFITANLQYAMLTDRDPRLRAVNAAARFMVADGMPLVWRSWLGPKKLPQRVAGSDLIYALCRRAAQRGYGVFLLGGLPGVADEAASKLCQLYPGLHISGVEVPPFRPMTPEENTRLVERIRSRRPDLLFAALGQPKGELWLFENWQVLGAPLCVQVGAALDFVAGRIPRAPRWMQRTGLEWAFRIWREPRRMAPRYAQNALFLLKALGRDWAGWRAPVVPQPARGEADPDSGMSVGAPPGQPSA